MVQDRSVFKAVGAQHGSRAQALRKVKVIRGSEFIIYAFRQILQGRLHKRCSDGQGMSHAWQKAEIR